MSRIRQTPQKAIPTSGRYSVYKMLTKDPSKILDEVVALDIIPFPAMRKRRPDGRKDTNRYYNFHRDYSHNTDKCIQLRDDIEDLIRKGRLSSYAKSRDQTLGYSRTNKKDLRWDDKREQDERGRRDQRRPTRSTPRRTDQPKY